MIQNGFPSLEGQIKERPPRCRRQRLPPQRPCQENDPRQGSRDFLERRSGTAQHMHSVPCRRHLEKSSPASTRFCFTENHTSSPLGETASQEPARRSKKAIS